MLEEIGLARKEDVTEELKPHRMNQNSKNLNTLLNAMAETMNPLIMIILLNIATGKAAQEETAIISPRHFFSRRRVYRRLC